MTGPKRPSKLKSKKNRIQGIVKRTYHFEEEDDCPIPFSKRKSPPESLATKSSSFERATFKLGVDDMASNSNLGVNTGHKFGHKIPSNSKIGMTSNTKHNPDAAHDFRLGMTSNTMHNPDAAHDFQLGMTSNQSSYLKTTGLEDTDSEEEDNAMPRLESISSSNNFTTANASKLKVTTPNASLFGATNMLDAGIIQGTKEQAEAMIKYGEFYDQFFINYLFIHMH